MQGGGSGGGGGRRMYKTKLCILWQRGRCSRPTCNFAHGEQELRRAPFMPPHFPGCGRRDYRGGDLRDRLDRRYSPRRRYSPMREGRSHLYHDHRPISHDRGSSRSRSPIGKSERRYKKPYHDGESNSSGSLKGSGSDDDKKRGNKYSSDDDKEDREELKQILSDIEVLRNEKSQLEGTLDEKAAEVDQLSSTIDDLEDQLDKKREESRRISSKLKKFIKLHGRYLRAQEDLKRSQSRLLRLCNLAGSDVYKPIGNEEDSSVNVIDDGEQDDDDKISPSDHLHKGGSSKKRRGFSHSVATEEAKEGHSKKRGRYSEEISRSQKYRSEGLYDNNSKGVEMVKPTENHEDKQSKHNDYTSLDKVKGSEMRRFLPSTGMAAHAVDDLVEAAEVDEILESVEATVNHGIGDIDLNHNPTYLPPLPPIIQNSYKQHEGDDAVVDVENAEAELVDYGSNDVEIDM